MVEVAVDDLLVLHGGALGDLVLTVQLALRLPGIRADSTLEVLSRTDPGDLSECQPRVRRVSLEGLGAHWLYGGGDDSPPERLRELVAGQRVLNALGDADSVVHRRLNALGARAVHSFDPRPKADQQTHITAQWQRQLERQGVLFPKCIYEGCGSGALVVPEELRKRGRGGGPGRAILIHPGSGGRAKCWPLRCFLELGRCLRAKDLGVCFIVGPVEGERWATDELEAVRSEFPLIASPEPDELVGLLAAAGALISNDSGPAHLAALLGTPTVTIFGPTSPAVWRPVGPAARYLHGDPGSQPADWGISPARVIAAVDL
jgi:heptosyltransferase-3